LQENINTFKEENDLDEEDSIGLRNDKVFMPSAEREVGHNFKLFLCSNLEYACSTQDYPSFRICMLTVA
jgi:hypothetical protein